MHFWLPRLALVGAFLASFLLMGPGASARDETMVMQVGRDTRTMHPDLKARKFITVPPSEDEYWAYLIIMNAVFHEYKNTNVKIDLPALRDVTNADGAYGLLYKGTRVMLVSTKYRYNLVAIGHELGHHVCGHFENIGPSKELELEADQFAGAFARAVNKYAYGDDDWFKEMRDEAERNTVFKTAKATYSPLAASDTHPDPAARIAAFEAGYNAGSNCLSRKILEVRPERPVAREHK
jgi:hypothetical protein